MFCGNFTTLCGVLANKDRGFGKASMQKFHASLGSVYRLKMLERPYLSVLTRNMVIWYNFHALKDLTWAEFSH